MIWLFEHSSAAAHIESQYDNVSGEYVLTVRTCEHGETTERFRHHDAFEARLAALEQRVGTLGLGTVRSHAADWRLS
jgi:hypothetical protein